MKQKFLTCLLACTFALSAMNFVCAEDTTETTTEAAEENAGTGDLSDDIYSFQFKLDGELYTLPMSYDDFVAKGWEYDGDLSEDIPSMSYTFSERFYKGNLEAYASFFNPGINAAPYTGCLIGSFSVDEYQFEDAPDTVIELPGGITYGVSTLDDITAAYGTASDTYEGELYTQLTYDYASYQSIELYVDKETGVLNKIDIENLVVDTEANQAAAAEVSSDPTEAVLAYEAPTELGDDPLSFTVEFAGDLYQLPAPVSAFLENGWTIKPDDTESIVAGGSSGWVSMMKDNQEFRTLAKNFDPNATVIENCFIRDMEANVNDCNVSIVIPSGVTIGMSRDELLETIKDMNYVENTETSDMFTYYNINGRDEYSDYIQILVYNDENKVTGIAVENNSGEPNN